MITSHCHHCGKQIQFFPSDKRRFCSYRCRDKGRTLQPIEKRFWKKVKKTDHCWEWTASCKPAGYGQMFIPKPKRMVGYAHRISWELSYGSIPPTLCVLHRCDNPKCVRPTHLFLGTKDENQKDAGLKNRMPYGDSHWMRKNPDRLIRNKITGRFEMVLPIMH